VGGRRGRIEELQKSYAGSRTMAQEGRVECERLQKKNKNFLNRRGRKKQREEYAVPFAMGGGEGNGLRDGRTESTVFKVVGFLAWEQ